MARIPSERPAPVMPPGPTSEARAKPLELPEAVAAMVRSKQVGLHTVVAGETLESIRASWSPQMTLVDFEALNVHLKGKALLAGDQVAVPPKIQDVFTTPVPPVMPGNANAFVETAKASDGFTFGKLGAALIEDADVGDASLSKEQHELHLNHAGLIGAVITGAGALGAATGKTAHGLERLAGLALEGLSYASDHPADALNTSIDKVSSVSVGGVVKGGIHVAEGLGKAFVDAADQNGITSAVVETAANVAFTFGVGGLSKAKLVEQVADAAEAVAGKEAAVVQAAEAAKSAVKNESLTAKLADIAQAIEPVVNAAGAPTLYATRATAAAAAIRKAPSDPPETK